MLTYTELKTLIYKFKAMKKKIIGFALVIAAFVSITSGCVARVGYDHHHDHEIHDHDH
jgi:hypothetical protein